MKHLFPDLVLHQAPRLTPALLASLLLVSHQESYAQGQNEKLYKQLNGYIYTLVTGKAADAPPSDTDPIVQIATVPTTANWAVPNYGSYNAATIADAIPAPGEFWNPTSDSLYDNYYKFFRSIKLPPGPTKAQSDEIERLGVESNKALGAWQAARRDAKVRYEKEEVEKKSANNQKPISFNAWLTQEAENERLANLRTSRNLKDGALFKALQDAYHGVDVLINDLSGVRAAGLTQMIDELGNSFEVAPVSVAPSLSTWLTAAKAAAADPASRKVRWEISDSTKTRDFRTQTVGGGGGGGFGFLKFKAKGSTTSTTLNTTANNFNLTIEFPSWQRFEITRPWFKPAYFRNYKNDSQFDFGPQKLFEANPHEVLFGQNGKLKYIVKSLIVVYKPKITVRMDAASYNSLKTAWQASAGGSYGPFRVGASGSGQSESEVWKDAANEVELSSPIDDGQIIAVVLERIP